MYVFSFVSKYLEFVSKPAILALLILIIIKLIIGIVSGIKKLKYKKAGYEYTSKQDASILEETEISEESSCYNDKDKNDNIKIKSNKRKISKIQLLLSVLGILGLSGLIITEQMPWAPIFSVKNIVTQISSISIIAFCLILSSIITFGKNQKNIFQKIKVFLISHLTVIVGTYIVLFLFLFLFQDDFIIKNDFIYHPTSISSEKANSFINDNIEGIAITTPDKINLQGWYVKNSKNKEKAPLVIFFGGSGKEVSYMIDYAKKLDGWNVALLNYRGFGFSGGTPTEAGIIDDAVFLYDTFSTRKDIDNTKIVNMGWSLGANVATFLSEKRKVAGTVLIAPSDSETHWFQRACFPYIPLWLFRTQYFDAESVAPSIDNPLLCLIGEKDVNNPPDLAKNLVSKWKGEKTVIEYESEDHQLLFHNNNSWIEIKKFLKKFE